MWHKQPTIETASASLPPGYVLVEVSEERHFEQVADLWSLCFGLDSYDVRNDELNFAKKHCSSLYAVIKDDRVCATTAIIMFEMLLNGTFVPCAGIASVATDPPHRHQNLVKAMMHHSLKKVHEMKVPVASLHPFSFPYYERMGFAVSHLSYKIKAPVSWLRAVSSSGDCRKYRFTELNDFEPAAQVHERSLLRWNATLRRSHERWRMRLFDFGAKWRLLCHDDAYMLWNTKNKEARTLDISEWNYVTTESYLDGLAVLGTMESQVDWVQWIDGDIAPLVSLGVSHPKPTFELQPTMMSRVVNLDAFQEAVGKLNYDVYDPLALTAPLRASADAIDPGRLFQLATGFKTSTTPGSIERGTQSRFVTNYCNDFF
ncbi:MAG TPA: GNAT family N-acetyltransferase [Oculatellaceae cyanobacterium]